MDVRTKAKINGIIREYMMSSGVKTIQALAERVGISPHTMSKHMKEPDNLTLAEWIRITKVLKIPNGKLDMI